MKQLLSSLLLTGCLITTINLPQSPFQPEAVAQSQTHSGLFYTFYGQQIPLTVRPNTIAVAFRETSGTRGSNLPLHVQLQQDLEGRSNTRGGRDRLAATQSDRSSANPITNIEVQPLGDRFALVTSADASFDSASLDQRIRQQSYVESTLPVLSVSDAGEDGSNAEQIPSFVLPNEIIVSFESDLSNSQTQMLLNRYGLEVIRPLRFTQNCYLVRAKTERGTDVLHLANRLNGVTGIQSATPNFIQSLAQRVQPQSLQDANFATIPSADASSNNASPLCLSSKLPSAVISCHWHGISTAPPVKVCSFLRAIAIGPSLGNF